MEYPAFWFIVLAIVIAGTFLGSSARVNSFIANQHARFRSRAVQIVAATIVVGAYGAVAYEVLRPRPAMWYAVIAAFFIAPVLGWFLSRGDMPVLSRLVGFLGLSYPGVLIAGAILRAAFIELAVAAGFGPVRQAKLREGERQ